MGSKQERRNSSALAMELCFSCINPSICSNDILKSADIYTYKNRYIYIAKIYIYIYICIYGRHLHLNEYIKSGVKYITICLCSHSYDLAHCGYGDFDLSYHWPRQWYVVFNAATHCLNQYGLLICRVLWHSPDINITASAQPVDLYDELKIIFLNLLPYLSRANE